MPQDESLLRKGFENILLQELVFVRRGKFTSDRFYSLTLEERNYFLHLLNEEAEKEMEHAKKMESDANAMKARSR